MFIGRSSDGLKCLDELYKLSPNCKHSFIQLDCSKLSNIKELDIGIFNKINYLIQCQGVASIEMILLMGSISS